METALVVIVIAILGWFALRAIVKDSAPQKPGESSAAPPGESIYQLASPLMEAYAATAHPADVLKIEPS